jgi:endoglucanase
LAHPTAKTTGGDDIAGSWTRSTSTAGYFQADYQVHAATTGTAWARWTPRFPSAGYYNVYLRWTSGWNRASNAKVTINIPGGQVIARVDQRSNGGLWMKVGRYYFQAGYSTGSGSVAVHATGADGYVVADAAYFAPSPNGL